MSVTPQFVGQRYKDTNTGNIWRANSLTPGDWTLEVQNMQVKWGPRTLKLAQKTSFIINESTVSALILEGQYCDGIQLQDNLSLLSVSAPDLTIINQANAAGVGGLSVSGSLLLTSVSLPLFSVLNSGDLNINFNDVLASLSLPSFITCYGGFTVKNNSTLTSFSAPNWVLEDGVFGDFRNNALDATSINHILARFVASPTWGNGGEELFLEGGTNAAPSGQGATDKATLIGRGASVSSN